MRLASIPRPVLVALGLFGPALTGCGDDGETGSDEATVAGCLLCPPETCGDGPITASGTDGATSTSGATSGEDDTLGPCLGQLPPESSSGTDTGSGSGTGSGTSSSGSGGSDTGSGSGSGTGMAAADPAEIRHRLIESGTLAPDVVDRLRRGRAQ